MDVLLTAAARRDLIGLYRFLAERNPTAAEAVVARIDERFSQLVRFPFIGRSRESLGPGLRSVLAGNHLIFYLVEGQGIVVIRVLDARMDIDEELRR